MTCERDNMRKAAVLVRSLDAATAERLLAQLSAGEAAAIREAADNLGPLDDEEAADVLSEFRRVRPLAGQPTGRGVELALSSPDEQDAASSVSSVDERGGRGKRFEFLEHAPTSALAPYLAREHAQTIALVLSHLAPARACAVLAALPEKCQAETMERLSALGSADPESVTVVERELAAWMAERAGGRGRRPRRETMTAILAAGDAATRDKLLSNLRTHKSALAEEIAPALRSAGSQAAELRRLSNEAPRLRKLTPAARRDGGITSDNQASVSGRTLPAAPSRPPAPPAFDFDDLVHLDGRTLAAALQRADANVLALALAGSRDDLVDRICEQMPKRLARDFRRGLHRLGPTRLSDVEAAQRAVAQLAAQQLAERRRGLVA